jgi:ATP-binding cassette, subfamily B (MDR/TAP), member 1
MRKECNTQEAMLILLSTVRSCRISVSNCRRCVQTAEEKAVKVSFFRLLYMNRKDWPYLLMGCAGSAAIGLVLPFFAFLLGEIISSLTPGQPRSEALKFSIIFWCIGLGNFLATIVQSYMFGVVGANLAEQVRRVFFRAVLYMEVAWFDKDSNTSGNLAARLASDAPSVRGAMGDTMGVLVQNVTTMIAGYAIALLNGWKMTLVITAVLPAVAAATIVQMRFYAGTCSVSLQGALVHRFCSPLCPDFLSLCFVSCPVFFESFSSEAGE